MERWPPIYDAEDLANQIRELVSSGALEQQFYERKPEHLSFCQGDIFSLVSPIPVIDETGAPVAIDDVDYWMAIGNTCDFSRSLNDVPWTQLIPIFDLGGEEVIQKQELLQLRKYQPYRRFYVPYWKEDMAGRILGADFTRPVAVHKQAIEEVARLEARLSRPAWLLFHSCLVRFLARDDGRYD